jgi:hypothetical protein
MTPHVDVAALSHEELVALVYQLRQQLEERDQEIAHLKRQLAAGGGPATPDEPACGTPAVQDEPRVGSQEDLLAQLEKIYPEGR